MKNKPYRVTGNESVGLRIAVQQGHGVKVGDEYDLIYFDEMDNVTIHEGSMLYVPKVKKP
jgi:hypothetical protein